MSFLAKNKENKIYVTYSVGREKRRITLGEGRHLIGGSSFCAIQVEGDSNTIAAAIIVTKKNLSLKCINKKPGMFIDGKRLTPGQTVIIGDFIDFIVGSTNMNISAQDKKKTIFGIKSAKENTQTVSEDEEIVSLTEQTELDRLRQSLARNLLDQMNMEEMDLANVESEEVREKARLKLRKIVGQLKLSKKSPFTKEEIEKQVFDEVLGLGPLEPLLADKSITEIMVNRRDQIYIESEGNLKLSKVNFSSNQSLLNVIERIVSSVGRRIDTASPIVDARLLDGSRVNAVIPPLALNGPCLTIRRFSETPISVKQLVKWDALTQQMADFLKVCVRDHKNMIISGGTGSGKTTLLNAMSSFVPNEERLVTIEDAAELQLQQEHVIRMETRPANLEGVGAISIRDLVKNTLRMRPDRIIVGECRGAEALDMLQAMNTGHDGSMTTAHANSPEDMLRRLETMVMMAGMDLPLNAIREQIVSAMTIIVQQTRRKTGRRLITDISWVRSLNRTNGQYEVIQLMSRDRKDKLTIHTANLKTFWKEEDMIAKIDKILPKKRVSK